MARGRTLLPLGVLLFGANRRYSGLLGGGSELLSISRAGAESFAEIEPKRTLALNCTVVWCKNGHPPEGWYSVLIGCWGCYSPLTPSQTLTGSGVASQCSTCKRLAQNPTLLDATRRSELGFLCRARPRPGSRVLWLAPAQVSMVIQLGT